MTSSFADSQSENIIFGERDLGGGRLLGLVLLNRPERLNVIDTAMFKSFDRQLDRWETNDRVVGLGIAGVGDRGFCAGGDVVALHTLATGHQNPDRVAEVEAYFELEYRVQHRIRDWGKPTISVAGGFCMGSGLGLVQATSHRILLPDALLAMPEVKIGLFPDVGACAFLQELPHGLGRLMALTGVGIGARDALWSGLGTVVLEASLVDSVWDRIAELRWSDDLDMNWRRLSDFVAMVHDETWAGPGASNLFQTREPELRKLGDASSVVEFTEILERFAESSPIFDQAFRSLRSASPLSVEVTDWYLSLSEGRTVQEVLATDLILAGRMVADGDFVEGVRSVLVDKDNSPDWKVGVDSNNADPLLVSRLLANL